MAAHDNSQASQGATLGKYPAPLHDHDDWLVREAKTDVNAQFASTVIDVALGARVIASILSTHLVDLAALEDGAHQQRILLSKGDTQALARLAVVSLDQLYKLSHDHVDRLNIAAEKGACA